MNNFQACILYTDYNHTQMSYHVTQQVRLTQLLDTIMARRLEPRK